MDESTAVCKCCAGPLPRKYGRGRRPHFCSDACRHKKRKARHLREYKRVEKPSRACEICGAAFVPRHRRNRYCSKSCQGKARYWRIKADPIQRERLRAKQRREQHRRRQARIRTTDLTIDDEVQIRRSVRRCGMCRTWLTSKHGQPNSKHLDHVVPLCVGGTHTFANVRIICALCNQQRPKDGSDLGGEQVALWSADAHVFPAAQEARERDAVLRAERKASERQCIDERIAARKHRRYKRALDALQDVAILGLSWQTVAQRHGYPHGTTARSCVGYWFGQNTIKGLRPRAAPRGDAAARLRSEGLAWREIAVQLGFSSPNQARKAATRRGQNHQRLG